MNKSETKKMVSLVLGVAILLAGVFFDDEYLTEPKILDGIMSKKIDYKGNPVDVTTTFSPEDTVYFSAKRNRFWIKKAQVVWYKGEIQKRNRFLVEKAVAINKAGYFSSKLSVPEGLEEGHYSVTIYIDGSKIRETSVEFDVKK